MAIVLLIEDHPDNRQLMAYLLTAFGHAVVEAVNGESGLQAARKMQPEIILCDLQMPGLDGYEVAGQLKQDPQLRAIPLVAVTAFAMVGDREKVLAAGFDGYIAKPINPESFVGEVEAYLGKPTAPPRESGPATILIVDDRPTNRDLLVTLLGYSGYRLLQAADGEAGLALARAERPDLIITDIVMPKMDGYEFARQVRADPAIGQTQIIFCTSSFVVEDTRRLAEACGVSVVISKPIEPASFLEQIQSTLAVRTVAPAQVQPEAFHHEHMRLLTNTLSHKVDELEAEVAERKRVEVELRTLNAELERRVSERTQELTHANRAKDEFLAGMSHELRTPLNTVLGLSEMLLEQRRGPLTAGQQQAIQLIQASGQHLLSLINDVLDVAKVEAGKMQIHPIRVSVPEVCEASLNFVQELAIRKSIALEFWNDAGIESLHVDPQRLKQILVNLLSNAVKFTPEKGNVSLEVELNDERDQIRFVVTDNGIGIAPDDLRKLFTPFTQLDSSLARQNTGSGLGLVLVYQFAELHGGSVQVESEPGRGSRFTVSLPWRSEPSSEPAAESEPSQAPQPGPALAGPAATLLLAEDNEANILVLGDYLEAHGFQMVVARTGFEALDQAESQAPALILMDIQLPEVDGLEVIRRLRAKARFAATPIIALTALAMPGDRERCLAAGATEYLSKPVSLGSLRETIQRLLKP